jgi:hypothetical protein
MKILILVSDIGQSAPGVVFERLIMGLSSSHQLTIISANNNSKLNLSKVNHWYVIKKIKGSTLIHKPMMSYFGFNILDILWARKVFSYVKSLESNHFDVVFSFISNHKFAPLIAGYRISMALNCRFALYSVDAIPAFGWPEESRYYLKVEKMMKKYLNKVNALYSSNFQMLNYQLSFINNPKEVVSDVIYNPIIEKFNKYSIIKGVDYCFVYTGKIYGLRNPKYVLEAFEKLLLKYKNSKLIFVEAIIPKEFLSNLKIETIEKIEFHPFVTNLEPFYTKATALIDIDAELDNDLFMSSKITNYININRIIISESSFNSPSNQLFKNIHSVFQCSHNSDEICDSMIKAIELKLSISYEDRNNILTLFNLDNVINRLNKSLNLLKLT